MIIQKNKKGDVFMAEKKDNAVEEIESKITDEENIEPIEMDDDFLLS